MRRSRTRSCDDDPEVARAYREWDQSRIRFMERSKAGGVKPDEWQRDYFLGRDASGRQVAPVHMTKVKPPHVRYEGSAALANPGHGTRSVNMPGSGSERPVALGLSIQEPGSPGARFGRGRSSNRVPAQGTWTTRRPAFRPVTDEWRRWIAENLMLGASRESILQDDGRRAGSRRRNPPPRSTWPSRAPI